MPAHKGPMPSAQPRTLRQLALTKGTVPAGFDGGQLAPEVSFGQQYVDRATAALPPPSAAVRDADPQPVPFKLGR